MSLFEKKDMLQRHQDCQPAAPRFQAFVMNYHYKGP